MPIQENAKILVNSQVATDFYKMLLAAPKIAKDAIAGQFINIKLPNAFEPMLRRPLGLYKVDAKTGEITILYKVVGKGTEALSKMVSGDELDIIGPLGNGFELKESYEKVILVGGGTGVVPLHALAEAIKDKVKKSLVILGGRSKEQVLAKEDFTAKVTDILVCTDDGSEGFHGLVTDALRDVLKKNKCDVIFTCGPHRMMQGVTDIGAEFGIPVQVSLEEVMGCGVGACLSCICKTKKDKDSVKHSRVCTEGPVFLGSEVIW